jgi:hypothetical protein
MVDAQSCDASCDGFSDHICGIIPTAQCRPHKMAASTSEHEDSMRYMYIMLQLYWSNRQEGLVLLEVVLLEEVPLGELLLEELLLEELLP